MIVRLCVCLVVLSAVNAEVTVRNGSYHDLVISFSPNVDSENGKSIVESLKVGVEISIYYNRLQKTKFAFEQWNLKQLQMQNFILRKVHLIILKVLKLKIKLGTAFTLKYFFFKLSFHILINFLIWNRLRFQQFFWKLL